MHDGALEAWVFTIINVLQDGIVYKRLELVIICPKAEKLVVAKKGRVKWKLHGIR